MKIERAKGTRDFPPEEQILRQEAVGKIRQVFESYGFSPIETPVLERYDVLTAKFGAGTGTDVMNEIFRLNDQGKRDLGLKFDQTVPLARYIAMNPTVKLPLKRYAIDRAFRDGPLKLGRYREFWQCDADIVGPRGMAADYEIISLAIDVFSALDMDITFEINSRNLLSAILKGCSIKSSLNEKVMIILDKLAKYGEKQVKEELLELDITDDQIEKLLDIFTIRDDILKRLENKFEDDEIKAAVGELKELMEYLDKSQKEKVKLNISLARGLNYYTGTVFEAFLKDSKITSSVAGGGRYDNMIGGFCKNKDFPAVGIAFGLDPIIEAMKLKQGLEKKTVTDILIIPIAQFNEADKLAKRLRKSCNVEVDIMKRGVSKNLKYANNYNIPYVLFLGEEEVAQKKAKLRDMKSGKEELVSFDNIDKKINLYK